MKNIPCILCISCALFSCKKPEESDLKNAFEGGSNNDPIYYEKQFFTSAGVKFEKMLKNLPTKGQLETAWSDTYLPNVWAGAAVRWYQNDKLGDMEEPHPAPEMWKYKLHTLIDLKKMTLEELKSLSPSEKFDIYMSRYDYPLTTVERERNKPTDADWEGVCNGWSTAALKFSEPPAVDVVNKDGIKIPFASSDIKSLLMLHQYFVTSFPKYAVIGDRCADALGAHGAEIKYPNILKGDALDACSDSNAGAFHLIITNMLGKLKKGLVFDVDRDAEVWNQPVYRFESQISNVTSKGADVSTRIWYAEETMFAWDPLIPQKQNIEVIATYNYSLELDIFGKIIGGRWKDGQDPEGHMTPLYHPDFVWYGDGENLRYERQEFEAKGKKIKVQKPINFGGIVDLWEKATGKKL